MVGLLSVYPDGIRPDKIPFLTDYSREQIRLGFKPMDQFILQLDKFCSLLFSLCFLLVLILLGICLLYAGFLGLFSALRWILGEDGSRAYEEIIYFGFFGLIMLLGITNGLLTRKPFRDNLRLARWQYRLSVILSAGFLPFIGWVVRYIMYVYYSNLPKKRIIGSIISLLLVFYVFIFYVIIQKKAPQLLDFRAYYSRGSEYFQINPRHYDNLRASGQLSFGISIQSDIVQGDFLKLFLAYPKHLDEVLDDLCNQAEVPDSLNRYERRALKDRRNLQCLADYYRIHINDSLYARPVFMYYEHPETYEKGIISYLPADGFQAGQNILKVSLAQPNPNPNQEKDYLYVLPFWYQPPHFIDSEKP
ncbi:MAG: hypothetical protein HC880_04810 [Bacteroidia bacterium]|nr:hypothetical protein [Bacteroidia bacterium]